jgi:hypothetical protein
MIERTQGVVDFLCKHSDALGQPGLAFQIAPNDDDHGKD